MKAATTNLEGKMFNKAMAIERAEQDLEITRGRFADLARSIAQDLIVYADRAEASNPTDPNSLGVIQGRGDQLAALCGEIKQAKLALEILNAIEEKS